MDMNQDEEHLKLLSTFHYVLGGVTALFSLFPVIHLVVGLFFILAPEKMSSHGEPPPAFVLMRPSVNKLFAGAGTPET
jgi:hypothetical protein